MTLHQQDGVNDGQSKVLSLSGGTRVGQHSEENESPVHRYRQQCQRPDADPNFVLALFVVCHIRANLEPPS